MITPTSDHTRDTQGPGAERYFAALAWAAQLHRQQFRKGAQIPYITHLAAVSGLVWEYGGDEDQAIAGLLHDALEDQAEAHGGVAALRAEIHARFGAEVLRMVQACTDSSTTPKPPWRLRKEAYLAHLATVDHRAALVSCCDKLHNARTVLADWYQHGAAVFARFSMPQVDTLWYYAQLARQFGEHHPGAAADELARTVAHLLRECAGPR